MQAREPTTLLLDGRPAWPTGANQQVSVGPASGIRLAADPHGPLSPRWRDGSFGGLAMPRGMALDERATLHLLDETTLTVKRFDPSTGTFAPLPTVGGPGRAVRRFRCPTGIAIVGESLYVADAGNMRVQVFELGSLALLHIWRGAWVPVDVAAQAGAAYILDRRFGRVYRHNPRRDGLRLVIDCATSCPASAGRWSRIAVDRDGHIYLWNVELQQLEIFDGEGRFLSATDEVGGLRERFAPPPIRLDHRERFCLPASLTRPCERRAEPMGLSSGHWRSASDRRRAGCSSSVRARRRRPPPTSPPAGGSTAPRASGSARPSTAAATAASGTASSWSSRRCRPAPA